MNTEKRDNRLDQLIQAAIATDSAPFDFQQWKQEHQRQVDEFRRQVRDSQSPQNPTGMTERATASVERRRTMIRTLKLVAAAAIFIGICLGLPRLGHRQDRNTAFAQMAEQIEKAKAVTWKITFYTRVTSNDGKRTWIETEERDCAYKAPGLYQDVFMNKSGRVRYWMITDSVNEREVTVNPRERKATVREMATMHGARGPFAWVMEEMKKHNLQWVGTKQTPGGEVNVFRAAFRDEANNRDWSYDFWIHAETKQLVALQVPGSDIFDPENDPAGKNKADESRSGKEPLFYEPACFVDHDIRFDAELDDSLFSFEPPAGYTVEVEGRPQVTEEEMVAWLGLLAEYYDGTFPDHAIPPFDVPSDRVNAIHDKTREDRTPIEQRLLDTQNRYMMANVNEMPVAHFLRERAVKDSFRYLGKGVRLGDKDRIVCWYRLKGAATYRVVYGDLSIKDVLAEDLPLPVEP